MYVMYFEVTFSVVDHFFPKQENAWFFPDEVDMGRAGSGLGLGLGLGLELVSKAVFRAFIFRNIPSHNTGTTR